MNLRKLRDFFVHDEFHDFVNRVQQSDEFTNFRDCVIDFARFSKRYDIDRFENI
jgi:hypothetical protein